MISAEKSSKKSTKAKGVSLRVVVFSLMLTGAIAPLGLYSLANFSNTQDALEKAAANQLSSSNKANSRTVSAWIRANEDAIRTAAQTSEIKSMDAWDIKPYLDVASKQLPMFYALAAIDKNGMQIARSNEDKLVSVADRDYFKKAMEGAKSAIQTGISKTTNKPAFFVASPIRDASENKPIGALAGYADMTAVVSKITTSRVGETGFSFLVDAKGQVLAHPDLKKVSSSIDPNIKQMLRGEYYDKVISHTLSDGKEVNIVANSAGQDLVLLTQIDKIEVQAPVKAAMWNAIKFISGSAVLATLFAVFFSHGLSSKIVRLSALTVAVSRARSEDEIKGLEQQISEVGGAAELRNMAVSVKRLTASIKLAMRSL